MDPASEVDLDRLLAGEKERLVARTSSLLHNKSFTDVTFIVGPASHSRKYVGHRVLLAMTSPGRLALSRSFSLTHPPTLIPLQSSSRCSTATALLL